MSDEPWSNELWNLYAIVHDSSFSSDFDSVTEWAANRIRELQAQLAAHVARADAAEAALRTVETMCENLLDLHRGNIGANTP